MDITFKQTPARYPLTGMRFYQTVVSRGGQGAGSLGESKVRRGVGGRR